MDSYFGAWSSRADLEAFLGAPLEGDVVVACHKPDQRYSYVLYVHDGKLYQVNGAPPASAFNAEGQLIDPDRLFYWNPEEIQKKDLDYKLEIATLNNYFAGVEAEVLTVLQDYVQTL